MFKILGLNPTLGPVEINVRLVCMHDTRIRVPFRYTDAETLELAPRLQPDIPGGLGHQLFDPFDSRLPACVLLIAQLL
ncbi:hypothetical protein HDF11_005239 [Tunturiibacter psychrotolerans]|jgi:hypothetical protein